MKRNPNPSQAAANRRPAAPKVQSRTPRRQRRHSPAAVEASPPGNGDGARAAGENTTASARLAGEAHLDSDGRPRDPNGASPLPAEKPPQHKTWEEMDASWKPHPFGELPICSPGLCEGLELPVDLWLQYAANVIRDHADAILRNVLPRLKGMDGVEWRELIELASTISLVWEKASDPAEFRSHKYRVDTGGIGRFTFIEFSEALFHVMHKCHCFAEELTAVFLDQEADERSALEWCEVLYAAEHYVDNAGMYDKDATRMERYKQRALLAKQRLWGLGEFIDNAPEVGRPAAAGG